MNGHDREKATRNVRHDFLIDLDIAIGDVLERFADRLSDRGLVVHGAVKDSSAKSGELSSFCDGPCNGFKIDLSFGVELQLRDPCKQGETEFKEGPFGRPLRHIAIWRQSSC